MPLWLLSLARLVKSHQGEESLFNLSDQNEAALLTGAAMTNSLTFRVPVLWAKELLQEVLIGSWHLNALNKLVRMSEFFCRLNSFIHSVQFAARVISPGCISMAECG